MHILKKIIWLSIFILSPAYGWWATGHEIIAAIAYDHLTPHAKQQIHKLLTTQIDWPTAKATKYLPEPKILAYRLHNFITASAWADSIKDYQWANHNFANEIYTKMHFMNIAFTIKLNTNGQFKTHDYYQINWQNLAKETNRKSYGDNILAATKSTIKTLLTTNTSNKEKAIALRYLIHLSGDMYMPFHATTPILVFKDKYGEHKLDTDGGNLIFFNHPTINVPSCENPHFLSYTPAYEWHLFWDAGIGALCNIPEPNSASYDPHAWANWKLHGRYYLTHIITTGRNIQAHYKPNKYLNTLIAHKPQLMYWLTETARLSYQTISANYYGKNLYFKIMRTMQDNEPNYHIVILFGKDGMKDFRDRAGFIVNRQLYIAGIHLAYLLNAIFTNKNNSAKYIPKNYQIFVANIAKNNNIKTFQQLATDITQKITNKHQT